MHDAVYITLSKMVLLMIHLSTAHWDAWIQMEGCWWNQASRDLELMHLCGTVQGGVDIETKQLLPCD